MAVTTGENEGRVYVDPMTGKFVVPASKAPYFREILQAITARCYLDVYGVPSSSKEVYDEEKKEEFKRCLEKQIENLGKLFS